MATIHLHTKRKVETIWNTEYREFAVVPTVGEYVALSPESPWYEVHLVVHTPYKTGSEAEVYVVEAVRGRSQTTELIKKAETME